MRWSRAEKNYEMVKQVIERRNGWNIHVVGDCVDEIEGAGDILQLGVLA